MFDANPAYQHISNYTDASMNHAIFDTWQSTAWFSHFHQPQPNHNFAMKERTIQHIAEVVSHLTWREQKCLAL